MKQIFYIWIAIIAIVFYACRESSLINESNISVQRGIVNLILPSAPPEIVEVIAKLSRSGFQTQVITLSINDSDRTATGSFHNIAVGTWHLRVDALDNSNIIRYTGEADVEVIPNQTTVVDMVLYATSGSIEIRVSWGTPVCLPIPENIVSFWTGDETADDLMGINSGILQNGVSYGVGKVKKAFVFDGIDDIVRIPHSNSLNPVGSFSIEAWIYPIKDAHGEIISKWGDWMEWDNQRSWVIGLRPGLRLEFSISDSIHQRDEEFHHFYSPYGSISLKVWNHVVAIYDQQYGTRKLYINGTKVAERVDEPIIIHNGIADVAIGGQIPKPNTVQYPFAGKIDEVSFYNRALSDQEVVALYRAGSAGKCRN